MFVRPTQLGASSLNGYSIHKNSEKTEKEPEYEYSFEGYGQELVSAEDIMNAMNAIGAQNFAFVAPKQISEINPKDYLSQERIEEIEAMMGKFDTEVEKYAEQVRNEFGEISDSTAYTIAAKAYEDSAA